MNVRALRESDIPILQKMHAESGFDYEFPSLANVEAVAVVVDDHDQPVMACFAEKILQLYLFASPAGHPAAKQRMIRMLHEYLRPVINQMGYMEANCFLPPEIERSFGRRLMRKFGWVRNWASYCIR